MTLDPVTGIAVGVFSGPFPWVSGATPPDFNESDNAAQAHVSAVVTNNGIPVTVDVLSTGLLEVDTSGDGSPAADSSALVNGLDLDLLGNMFYTLLLGLDADTVSSTASVSGSCGTALTATGSTVLEGASASGSLSVLGGIDGAITAIPDPNFVLLDLDLGPLGQITVILNEQIPSGDGVFTAGLTVNAIHVIAADLLFGSIIDIDGEIIISQSKVEADCEVADISISKSDSPDPVTEGDLLTYTIMVNNNGPHAAKNVIMQDMLPANTTFNSALTSQGSCGHADGTVTCDLGDLADSAFATVTIEVTPLTDGQLSNTASVASDAFDPNTDNNSATEGTTVNAAPGEADLSVTKSDSPDPVTEGGTLSYTITVNNNGPDEASNVMLTDTLPASTNFVSAVPTQGNCSEAAGVVSCNLASIANGASVIVTIDVTPQQGGLINNTVVVDADEGDPNNGDNSASEDTTVTPLLADLSVSKSDNVDPVKEGQNLVYTIAVSNNGPDLAESVQVSDTLPPGVSYVSAVPSQGSCGHASGTVTCSLGNLADAANASIDIEVTADTPGLISNTAHAESDTEDPSAGDNSDSEQTTVEPLQANLSISKSDSADPVTEGDMLTYTLNVSNAGPDAAVNVQVADALPAGTTFDSATPSQGSCQHTAGTVNCSLGDIANGNGASIGIVVNMTEDGLVSNTATVASETDDPDNGDNSATEQTTVDAAPGAADLSVSKSSSPDPVSLGATLTYLVSISNGGPDDATDVQVTDALPAGVSYVTANPSQGSCGEAAEVVSCALGTLANGAGATINIEVTADEAGTLENTVIVDASEGDPNDENNSDTDTAAAIGQADLSIIKSDSPDPLTEGDMLTYTLIVSNTGPDDAENVIIEDTMPDSVLFESATTSQGSCSESDGMVTCMLGDVASGNDAMVTIEVTPTVDGQLSNTAVVSADTDDPAPGNNSDSEDSTVEPASGSADLAVSIIDDPDPAVAGETLVYVISVSNFGPDDASGVELTQWLPGQVSFVSVSSSQGSCSESGSQVECSLGAIANGSGATITVEVFVTAAGAFSSMVLVDADQGDPNDENNEDIEPTVVLVQGSGTVPVDASSMTSMILLILAIMGTVIAMRQKLF